jgi:hypothetical protein
MAPIGVFFVLGVMRAADVAADPAPVVPLGVDPPLTDEVAEGLAVFVLIREFGLGLEDGGETEDGDKESL